MSASVKGSTLYVYRQHTAELSGGTSSATIRSLVIEMLQTSAAGGSLLDFGAGKGDLLSTLYKTSKFDELVGTDLFDRSPELPESISWHQQDLNDTLSIGRKFDVVVCSETIEHLENPRQVF